MSDSVTYEYDLNGRLRLLTFNNDDALEVQYDGMGNRESTEITIASPLLPLAAQNPPIVPAADAGSVEQPGSSSK